MDICLSGCPGIQHKGETIVQLNVCELPMFLMMSELGESVSRLRVLEIVVKGVDEVGQRHVRQF